MAKRLSMNMIKVPSRCIQVPETCVYHGISMVHTHSWIERSTDILFDPVTFTLIQMRMSNFATIFGHQKAWSLKIRSGWWLAAQNWVPNVWHAFWNRNGPTSVGSLRLKLGRNFLWHTPIFGQNQEKIRGFLDEKNKLSCFCWYRLNQCNAHIFVVAGCLFTHFFRP